MKTETKKILKCGLVLFAIAGISSTLVSVVNHFASQVIAKNNKEKEEKLLREIYPSGDISSPISVNINHIEKYWEISNKEQGRIYKCSGKNAYGSITLLVGISSEFKLGRMSFLDLNQSYAQTLKDNYITPYMNSSNKEVALDNVSCGATFGAKLIQEMVLEAVANYKEGK